jgi:hypothetical protein
MAGAGADQVTVRGDELGRGDAAPASVPMPTEPASAQQEAFEFPGIPIPPSVTFPERYPARKNTRSDSQSPIGPALTPA